jgi:hypothetical protein
MGCAQKDSAVGSNLSPGLNDVYPKEIYVDASHSAFYQAQATTGSSPFLYLGFTQGYEAAALMRFLPTNTFSDSFVVDSATVTLYLDSVIVSGVNPLQFSVYSLGFDQVWDEIGVVWDTTSMWQLGAPLTTLEAPTSSGDSMVFSLNSSDSLIHSWRANLLGNDSTAFNNGFFLKAQPTTENLIRFSSGEDISLALRPKLKMFVTVYDSTDSGYVATTQSDSVYAYYDAFVAHDQANLDASYLYLGNAASYRLNLLCDFEGVFPIYGTAVQRAEVILHADTLNSARLGNISGGFTLAMEDTSWFTDPANATILFGGTPIVGSYSTTTAKLTINMTTLVRDWIANPGTNKGFLVKSANEYYDLSRTVFYGFGAPDSLRPTLHIVYLENQP